MGKSRSDSPDSALTLGFFSINFFVIMTSEA